jgi:hypothetical protein
MPVSGTIVRDNKIDVVPTEREWKKYAGSGSTVHRERERERERDREREGEREKERQREQGDLMHISNILLRASSGILSLSKNYSALSCGIEYFPAKQGPLSKS